MSQKGPNADCLAGFDRFVEQRRRDWDVPGCSVGIVKGDRVIWSGSFGYRDLARKLPVDEDTRFEIASCAKAITAAAAGVLVDQGKLAWDTPVRDYIRSFRMCDPVATRRATVRDLLAHRTGLPHHSGADPARKRRDLLKRLPYLQPCDEFRAGFHYSNKSYILAGLVIEAVTGKSWEEFARNSLLVPIGMKRAKFAAEFRNSANELSLTNELAQGYVKTGNGLKPWFSGWAKDLTPADVCLSVGPNGPVALSIQDMCQWVKFQLAGHRDPKRMVLRPRTFRELHTPQVVAPGWWCDGKDRLDASYALGWFVQSYRGHRCVFHGGTGGGFQAFVALLPNESIGVAVLTNMETSPVREILAFNVIDRLLGLQPLPWNQRAKRQAAKTKAQQAIAPRASQRGKVYASRTPLSSYTGDYSHPGYGELTVFVESGRLRMKHKGWPFDRVHYRLEPKGNHVFKMGRPAHNVELPKTLKATFKMRKNGECESLSVPFEPSVEDIVFKRLMGTR